MVSALAELPASNVCRPVINTVFNGIFNPISKSSASAPVAEVTVIYANVNPLFPGLSYEMDLTVVPDIDEDPLNVLSLYTNLSSEVHRPDPEGLCIIICVGDVTIDITLHSVIKG